MFTKFLHEVNTLHEMCSGKTFTDKSRRNLLACSGLTQPLVSWLLSELQDGDRVKDIRLEYRGDFFVELSYERACVLANTSFKVSIQKHRYWVNVMGRRRVYKGFVEVDFKLVSESDCKQLVREVTKLWAPEESYGAELVAWTPAN